MHHHIFLSYSRRNLTTMQRVRDDLRAMGLRVWTDEGIEPGSISWKEAIEAAIRDAGIVIVLLSPSANDSRWVQREIDYTETLDKTIVPILIKGVERDAVPFALAGSQFIDVRQDYTHGFDALARKCFDYLPSTDIPTIPTRRAATTIMSGRERRRRQRDNQPNWFLGVAVIIFAIIIGVVAFAIAGVFDASSVAADDSINDSDTIQLIYNSDTLVVHNTLSQTVDISEWYFELNSQRVVFRAQDWLTQTLVSGRCVQVWDIDFGYLSRNVPPATICDSRVAYRATTDIFWVSDNPRDTFRIRVGNQSLMTCPIVASDSDETLRCAVPTFK